MWLARAFRGAACDSAWEKGAELHTFVFRALSDGVTWLVANMEKSEIFMACVDELIKDQLLALSGINQEHIEGREHLWGSTEEKRKISLVAWDKVCCPKKFGEFNIKSCRNWNVASVGKLLWQLSEKNDSLWVHVVYMKTNTIIWTHQTPQDYSWYWKKMNALKEMMKGWYTQGSYQLTHNSQYSITRSYNAMLRQQSRLNIAELIWTAL
ncbi:hypothetical protein MTR67_047548 [Solanum verrucosum]|uniref:Uncharacterized protein n=1 Tax=Solanum verrucosum TaxID=315347 RepID=A0AAF0UZN1_SOLVR|nr:hypothetical protein MTR67_047548 [Solanum verrucosum]